MASYSDKNQLEFLETELLSTRIKAQRKILDVLDTGEAVFIAQRRRNIKEPHFMGIQEGFIALAKAGLTQIEHKVILALMGECSYENWSNVTQKKIATDLKITQPKVAHAIKKLESLGIISIRKISRTNYYQINPDLLFKGQLKNLPKVKEQFPKGAKFLN